MKTFNICLLFLLLSFSGFSQWMDFDSVAADVNSIWKVSFASSTVGYAVGTEVGATSGSIFKTSDGAANWTNLNYPTTNNPDLQNLHFVDDQNGYIAVRENMGGLTSTVYKTTDGGQNWTDVSPIATGTGYGTSCIHFTDVNNGYYAVENVIYKTVDGGQNWSEDTLTSWSEAIQHIDFADAQNGIAAGWDGTFAYSGVLFYTNDAGASWNEVLIPQIYTSITAAQRPSASNLFALSAGSFSSSSLLFRSMDSGASWDTLNLEQYLDAGADQAISMFFEDANTGYIGTDGGKILKTIDAGTTWTTDYSFSPPFYNVSNIEFSGGVGYAFTVNGRIAKLDNASSIIKIPENPILIGFPSPAQDHYRIDLSEISSPKSLRIFTFDGRSFWSVENPKPTIQTLDIEAWPTGIYIGIIECQNGDVYHCKITKQN